MATRIFCCGRCGEAFEVNPDSAEKELIAHGLICRKGRDGDPQSTTAQDSHSGDRTRRKGPKERRKG